MKEKLSVWRCNCRELLGPYQLNLAALTRCAGPSAASHATVTRTVTKNGKLAPHSPASNGAGRTFR
jgi:hypothetical protein